MKYNEYEIGQRVTVSDGNKRSGGSMIGQREIDKLTEYEVPRYMQEGLIEYFNSHRPPGGFLTAVLSNDLMGAFGKADLTNRHAMHSYAVGLFNCGDPKAYGSKEAVAAWIENKEDKEGP